MSEFLLVKNLFICAHEKNVEELKKAMNGLITKESEDKENKNQSSKKYYIIKDYTDANKNNVLHFAVYGNNFENIKFIIQNTDLINSINSDNQNGLIISILNKNTEISKYLLENNIDYNQKDKYNASPLLYSLITQNYEIFNILIEKNDIDINVNSYDKGNLISICIFEKNIKVLKKLFQKNISPNVEKSLYPHPLVFLVYTNENDLLFLYLTYTLYYYTKDEKLFEINKTNFDTTTDKIIVDLQNKELIQSILNNPNYDFTQFKNMLDVKDENNSSLLSLCEQAENPTGKQILTYYSAQ
ncbi:conserved Plasmodium protein, unknown function [Plasmodium vinckei vinckei]|uniref:Uncharacterized protein n=1 Tax=Plasmodium vinckei vinckei TaxID=54757 RepID=A0A449C122_PLAVN|nr:conserved Plasmodium protein, unknown function [Plasmodium vinckei vinckei]KEG03839.1 hypothetical protein YYE_00741 [Plasmodium vinckei vinckei]VEV59366.1 conserved Plasmodium protein, unknown function [Plasmodium vinckei vinckei]